jgi:hypothetical protein
MCSSFSFRGYPGNEIPQIRGLIDCVRPDCPVRAALRILRGWADILPEALNEAKQEAVKTGAEPENDS